MSAKQSGAVRSPRKRWPLVVLAAVCLALVVGVGTAWAEATFAKADYRWYTENPNATEYVITTGPEMQGLANLVNGTVGEDEGVAVEGPVTFEGKTVRLGTSVNLGNLFGTREFTPIGTAEHPFQGTFDGAGNTVKGMRITAEQNLVENIGMFGVVGEQGLIRNVNMDDSNTVHIVSAEQDRRIEDVGVIVGECQGSLENCTSAAYITVEYTPTDCTGKVIRNIGGIAGSVQGTVSGSSFSGQLRAETPVNAYEENNDTVAYVAENFGGVVGYIYGDLSSSQNSGNIVVVTSGQSGVDRFGATVAAKAEYIGGVAGYCMGNVSDCHNTADLFATSKAGAVLNDMYCDRTGDQAVFKADGGGNGMGGVVGSLRGIAKSGSGDNRTDPGVEGPDAEKPITMSDCTNTGFISGLHTVGGVVGSQGSYTLVTRCVNGVAGEDPSSNVGHVRTTRWNKPGCGGVVGQSWGATSYCRNHGTVENTRSGYYSAGIVGMIEVHETTFIQKETPEVWACYNTGNVFCDGGNVSFREGAIVGQNNGYVHDNVYLWGTVSTNLTKLTDDNQVAIGGQYGTEANNVAMYQTKAAADENGGFLITSGEAVAILNTTAPNNNWADYYFITSTSNNGYPVLNGEGTPDSAIDLSKVACQLTFVKNAPYTAAYNPIPKLKATITVNGETIQLVQGSDFVVVPDPAALDENGVCKGLTNGKQPYRAKIQGIGNYTGQSAQSVSYGIGKGNFSECRVMVDSVRYTGADVSDKAKESIKVIDGGGGVIDPADYTFVVNDGAACVNATSVGTNGYPVKATAVSNSNYEGTALGYFRIETVDIYRDVDVIGLEYGNRVWFYDESQTGLYEVIPTHADGTPIDQEAGEPLEYYKIPVGTDENGDTVYAVDGQGQEALVPYVMAPADFEEDAAKPESERKYGTNGQFVTYKSDEGRTLVIAEAKNKTEEGRTIYNDMSVEFTGGQIRPKVIGALLDGEWLPGSATASQTQAWLADYGATSDGSTFARPQNVNRTTNDETPQASVVVKGNAAAGYSNLTYMDFRITPIEATNENIKVRVKENFSLLYAGGACPELPKNVSVGDAASMFSSENQAFEVLYAEDPEQYDPQDPSTYHVLDVANWALAFDHAESEDGASISASSETDFEVGARVYYKVINRDQGSLLGWTEVAVEDPLVIQDSVSDSINLSDPAITVEVSACDYDPMNPTAGLKVYDAINDRYLVAGTDYKLDLPWNDDGDINYDVDMPIDPETGNLTLETCLSQVPGAKKYVGRSANITLEYIPGALDAVSAQAKYVVNYNNNDLALTTIPWKVGGWTKDDLSNSLTLTWKAFRTGASIDSTLVYYLPTFRENCFTVTKLMTGKTVAAATEEEAILSVGTTYHWFTVLFDESRASLIKGLSKDLADSGRRMLCRATSLSVAINTYGLFESMEFEHEYMYTGEKPELILHLWDAEGNDWGSQYGVVQEPVGADTCVDVGAHNEPDMTLGGVGQWPTGSYHDRWVGGDGVYYGKNSNLTTPGTGAVSRVSDRVDLSFSVVAADIADPSKVKIEVADAYLDSADGAVEPEVTFFDAKTGKQLQFKIGDDYSLEYFNNDRPGSRDDVEAPTVRICLQSENLSVDGRTGAGNYLEVPFDILGEGEDVNSVKWDYQDEIALLENGQLNQPGIVPSDPSLTYTALGASPDFAIELGVRSPEGEFVAKENGWQEGEEAYLRIAGVKTGVLTGETVVGPVKVVGTSAEFVVNASDTVFTAKPAAPALSVQANGEVLKEGRDYYWICDAVNVTEKAEVRVVGLGAYAGVSSGVFEITPASLGDESISVELPSKSYTGSTVTLSADDAAAAKVYFNGIQLSSDDWTLQNIIEDGIHNVAAGDGAGSVRLVAGVSGNFTEGSYCDATFDIKPIDLRNSELDIRASSPSYTGSEVTFDEEALASGSNDLVVFDKVRQCYLTYGKDYEIAGYSNNVAVGAATVYLNGLGNYGAATNTVAVPFEIVAAPFNVAVALPEPGYYDWQGAGNPVKPTPVVTFGNQILDPSQYTVTYGANDKVTELDSFGALVSDAGTLTVKPANNSFIGDGVTVSFAIRVDLSRATVAALPDATFEADGSYAPELEVAFNGVLLEEGVHYEVVDESGSNMVGQKTLTIRGINNCGGSRTFTFNVVGKTLTPDMVEVDDADLRYAGEPIEPVVTVKDGDYVLQPGLDYVCGYLNNNAASSATNHPVVEVTGIGNYAGMVSREFTIGAGYDLADAVVTVGPAPLFAGSPVAVPVTVEYGGTVLREGVDYSLSYVGNDQPGTAYVVVSGMGNYEGSVEASFALKGNLAAATVEAIEAIDYTGQPIAPPLKVTLSGIALVADVDYVASFSSNVEPGTAFVRLTGRGDYEGTTFTSFTIKPQLAQNPAESGSVVNNTYNTYNTTNTTNTTNGGATNNTTNSTTNNTTNGGQTTTTNTSTSAPVPSSNAAAQTPQSPVATANNAATADEIADAQDAAPAYSGTTLGSNGAVSQAEQLSEEATPLAAGESAAASADSGSAPIGNLFVQSPWFIVLLLLGVGLIVFLASLRYHKRNSE